MTEVLLDLYSKISGFCFVGGFLLIAFGYDRKTYIKRLLKRGIKTEGRVLELRQCPGPLFGGEAGKGLAPVVEYSTATGSGFKHYSSTYRTPSRYQVGQVVPLWFQHYRSRIDATLEDDEPGTFPNKLLRTGAFLMLIALPKIIVALPNLL